MKERKRRGIRLVGIVQLNVMGRPQMAYGRPCKMRNIPHEISVCEASLLTGLEFQRTKTGGATEPDGIAEKGGVKFFLEVDESSHLTKKQYETKSQGYAKVEGFVLIVTHGEERMKRVMGWCGAMDEVALFSTFERLKAGQGWQDRRGEVVEV